MNSYLRWRSLAGHRGNQEGETMAKVFERLKRIVAEQLGVEESQIMSSASFVDDLNADSLDLLELIMAMENV